MESQAPEIDVGTVIGETYEVEKLIGRGGMGAVWAARHLRLPGKRVAVKVLLGAAAGDRESFARFRREAEIASSIGHPNIIEVLDFNTLPSGTPYLVLELLEGEDLATRLARGALPLAAALPIVRQIGSALAAAHRHEVVHRDLKPGNIYLCPTESGGDLAERVKILDFGISKIRGSQTVQTQDSVLLGTPQYMSPEQASGRNQELDQRTDVFALGAIIYEMLAGRPAFSGTNLVAMVFQVVYEAAPSLAQLVPSLPPNVVAAVERAMAKDPAVRYPDVASLIADLTGRPLQTLDRNPAPSSAGPAFAPTVGAAAPPSTSARGELLPPRPVGGARVRIGIIAVALAGTVAAAIAIVKLAGSKPPPVTVAAIPPDLAPNAAPPQVAARALDLGGAPAKEPEHHGPAAATVRHPIVHPEAPLPAELIADLNDAERALSSGDAGEALRLARRSLNVRRSSRAFSIMTRAYCLRGDLGNANANFHSVTGADRAQAMRACAAHGLDLQGR